MITPKHSPREEHHGKLKQEGNLYACVVRCIFCFYQHGFDVNHTPLFSPMIGGSSAVAACCCFVPAFQLDSKQERTRDGGGEAERGRKGGGKGRRDGRSATRGGEDEERGGASDQQFAVESELFSVITDGLWG